MCGKNRCRPGQEAEDVVAMAHNKMAQNESAPPLVRSELNEDSGVATITLNRPQKKNALSRALLAELASAIAAARNNARINCIILNAEGDSFSSGRDLYDLRREWGDAESRPRWNDYTGSTMAIVKLLRDARQITIAAVQGYCLGGGLVLVNGCDLAVAADTAKIGMPEVIRGSYGRSATPTLFLSRIPLKTAFFIQLTGRNLSGAEAARVGLVSQSVPQAELQDYVMQMAREIASRSPIALEHAKIAAYTEIDLPFDLAIKADETIAHRMRLYTDPLGDLDGYLKSQRGGTNLKYKRRKK
jgi:enoyl-CoA hydratase/carnithine racemase